MRSQDKQLRPQDKQLRAGKGYPLRHSPRGVPAGACAGCPHTVGIASATLRYRARARFRACARYSEVYSALCTACCGTTPLYCSPCLRRTLV